MSFKENKNQIDVNDAPQTLHKDMEFSAAEQYKLLRTNLSFTLPEDKKCYIIGVTSSLSGEGKSTTSINLSYAFAEAEKKVLLIDGDLRVPGISKKMTSRRSHGLTDMMLGGNYDFESFKSEEHDKWYVMPTGDLPPNPSELLGSRKMERVFSAAAEHFDYIIIDLPPVNIVSDALAISNLLDGMILVVRENYTSKKDIDRCINKLKLSNVNILGCVMNIIENPKKGYRKNSKYGQYDKNYK